MKKIVVFLSLALYCCSGVVPMPVMQQQTKSTCWAAALASVVKYYKGYQASECEIVKTINLELYGNDEDCCDGSSMTLTKQTWCVRGGGPFDVLYALEFIFRLKYQYMRAPLSFEDIVKHIDQGHVIIAARVYPFIRSGHINTIVGYNLAKKTVRVAETTHGFFIDYDYYEYYSSLSKGIWTDSFIILDKPAKEQKCNSVFGTLRCAPN